MGLISLRSETVLSTIQSLNHSSQRWDYDSYVLFMLYNGECETVVQCISLCTQLENIAVRFEISDTIAFNSTDSWVEYDLSFARDKRDLTVENILAAPSRLWKLPLPIDSAKAYQPMAMNALNKLAIKAMSTIRFNEEPKFQADLWDSLAKFSDEIKQTAGNRKHIGDALIFAADSRPIDFHKMAEKLSQSNPDYELYFEQPPT